MGQSTELDPRLKYRIVPVLETADAPPPALTVEPAPLTVEPVPVTVELAAPPRDVPTKVLHFLVWLPVHIFGAIILMFGLAILAAVPVLQFLSLGYMLEAGGRIARTGRLRDGFIGTKKAAFIGSLVIGAWLAILPVRFLADFAHSAQIIDPGGRGATAWRVGLFAAIAIVFAPILLTLLVIVASGRYSRARDAVWNFVVSLRLPYYFWLGLRGFVGAFAWLVIPVTMLAMGRINNPLAGLVAFAGAVLLGLVLIYLPFLQMRLAQTNRFWSVVEWLSVRREFRKAPWAHAFAFFITLLFALPLFLLKIELVAREAAWIPSLFFVIFIFPARLLTGWALGRARRRGDRPRNFFVRWTGRLIFIPAAAFYVLIVFFTQYTSWNGIWSLYEQHALLLPVPFFGM